MRRENFHRSRQLSDREVEEEEPRTAFKRGRYHVSRAINGGPRGLLKDSRGREREREREIERERERGGSQARDPTRMRGARSLACLHMNSSSMACVSFSPGSLC